MYVCFVNFYVDMMYVLFLYSRQLKISNIYISKYLNNI